MKEKAGKMYVQHLIEDLNRLGSSFDKEKVNEVLMRRGEEYNKADRKKLMTMVRLALTGTNKGFVRNEEKNEL